LNFKKFLILSFPVFSFFMPYTVSSQISFSGEATLETVISSGEELPFWMYHNKRGRLSENTNLSGWVSGRGNYNLSYRTSLEIGGGILFQDGISDRIFIDELYARLESGKFYFTAGRKQQRELYNGLSASNRSILWSVNARPLPGIQIGTKGPLFIKGNTGLGVEGSWNEYVMEEDRHVSNAKLHHKNLLLVYRSKSAWEFKAGLQHFVQWGGVSTVLGQQPEKFKDYMNIIMGGEKPDPEYGEEHNAIGNHLGSYEIYVSKRFEGFNIEAFYNHLFDDGSGRRLGNTPDGRYGIFLEKNGKDSFINSLIYEFFYTHHQSHTTTGRHGADNYFNNSTYRSGWTYERRVLGAPFFTPDPEGDWFPNNKFTAHHLGIGGRLLNNTFSYPYKLLLSYARNDGRYTRPFVPKQDVAYIYSEIGLLRNWMNLDLQVGAEYDSYASPVYGVGVQARYQF